MLDMKSSRQVPEFPCINEHAITPEGFGPEKGNQPCYATTYQGCSLYLPRAIVENISTARDLFGQILQQIDYPLYWAGDRYAGVEIESHQWWKLRLEYAFSFVLIQRLK